MIEGIAPVEAGFSLTEFLLKHWYLVLTLIFLIPAIISSISTGIETNNWSYPVFSLATKILASDNSLYNEVNLLQTDQDKLIGMAHPDSGAWLHIVYYWKFFWNVIIPIISDLWLMFFPFAIIYMIMNLNKGMKSTVHIFLVSLIIFLVYMFITNAIVFIYDLVQGNVTFILPPNTDKFRAYLLIFQRLVPFHGVIALLMYLFQLMKN